MIDLLFVLPSPKHPRYARPGLHLRWRLGWIKGWVFRPYWKFREFCGGSRIEIGKRFSLQGALVTRGPGRVRLGDDCIVADRCTPFTHARDASIEIGSRVFLNGTRFGCSRRIKIGDDCILADARIFDTDFHSVHKSRNLASSPEPLCAPVHIGNNVWIAAGSAILKGTEIGDDSVVAFGSVVSKKIPSGKIFAGNPAIEMAPVPRD
ncbi:MAG: acyltransferase [Oligoflexia bacterium]|nr:acyltransferase [Oligoflexia bacterium]